MARPLRLELAGAVYHVTSRGDGREDIFLCDEDRLAWLEMLAEVCERFNWVCHARRPEPAAREDGSTPRTMAVEQLSCQLRPSRQT